VCDVCFLILPLLQETHSAGLCTSHYIPNILALQCLLRYNLVYGKRRQINSTARAILLGVHQGLELSARLKADQTKRTKIEADDILRRLVRIAEKTEQEGDYQAAIRSLELLGKHQAMWTDKNITEMEVKNAFATGNSEVDIQRDVERLKKIAAPHLKLVAKKESVH
jgi:hypothetical protein